MKCRPCYDLSVSTFKPLTQARVQLCDDINIISIDGQNKVSEKTGASIVNGRSSDDNSQQTPILFEFLMITLNPASVFFLSLT